MPRDEVDVRNIVSSKRVPRIALRLRDPLNGADAASVAPLARLSTATGESLDAVEQCQTATRDPLPEQAVPLKRQVPINEVEGGHGKRRCFPVSLSVSFHSLVFSATKQARSTASTPGASCAATPVTSRSHYSPTIEDDEDADGPPTVYPHQVQFKLGISISDSNCLTACRPQKQQTIIASDVDDEATASVSTGMDNAAPCVRKEFPSGACNHVFNLSHSTQTK